MKKTLAILLLCLVIRPIRGQTLTADTLAIRAILRANGISDTVPIRRSGPTPPPPPLFYNLGGNRVTYVGLSGLGITVITSDLGIITGLTDLDISNNQLTSLPPEIQNLTALTHFDLSRNQISTLPPEIGNLTALTNLNLSNNQLTTLPDQIGNLTQRISTFYFNNNQLTRLPSSFGNIGAGGGGSIDLNNNLLDSLPDIMWNARYGGLLLNNNRLTALPNGLSGAVNLLTLEVQDNMLTSLPDSIGKLSILARLLLRNNQIASLPQSFVNLTALGALDLFTNELTDLPWTNGNVPNCCGSTFNVDNNHLCDLDSTKPNLANWLDFNSTTANWGTAQRCGSPVLPWGTVKGGFAVFRSGSQLRVRWDSRDFTAWAYDTRGKTVTFLDGKGGEAVWEISREKKGVYLIRINSQGQNITRRITIY